MAYVKSFPDGFGRWVEIYLTPEQEIEILHQVERDHAELMKECITLAMLCLKDNEVTGYADASNFAPLAAAMFEKRAKPAHFYRESKAKEIFDDQHPTPKRPESIQTINNKSQQ